MPIVLQVGLGTGGTLDVYDTGAIDASKVTPETLAQGLSYVTRFGGQCGAFTVGEHSVNMARWAWSQWHRGPVIRACLMHDAAECLGVGDTQRFVKRMFQSPALTDFDHRLTSALWANLNPGAPEWSTFTTGVKRFDVSIGAIEAAHFGFPYDPKDLPYFNKKPYVCVPRKAPPEQVQREWLQLWTDSGPLGASGDSIARAGP